jgi:hypothetical protein
VKLSRTAKILLIASALVGLGLFLMVVDLGINAGRIHYGVRIDHINLGGLTELQALDVLNKRANEMRHAPMVFRKKGVDCTFLPIDVGWSPEVHRTLTKAMAVGRRGPILAAAGERLDAWLGSVQIHWPVRPSPRKMGRVVDGCRKVAESAGLRLAPWRMRLRIRRALVAWPRRIFRIPSRHN